MTPSPELLPIIDARNAALLFLVLGSGTLCPDAPEAFLRKLSVRWKRVMSSLRALRSRERSPRGSFWEIDMTKFEP